MNLIFKAIGNNDPLPSARYEATLVGVEVRDGKNGQYLVWKFGIEAEGQETVINMNTAMDFIPHSRERLAAEALRGREYTHDEDVDIEALYGARCEVIVDIEKREDGTSYNSIERVLAVSQDASHENVASYAAVSGLPVVLMYQQGVQPLAGRAYSRTARQEGFGCLGDNKCATTTGQLSSIGTSAAAELQGGGNIIVSADSGRLCGVSGCCA
jgi:hypothetical protein